MPETTLHLYGINGSLSGLDLNSIQNGLFADIFKRIQGDDYEEITSLNGDKLIIQIGSLPTFFTTNERKAIIIQKYDDSQKVSTPFNTSEHPYESSGSTSTPLKTPLSAILKNDLDVTGSPLRCPFSFDPGSPISSCVSSIKPTKFKKKRTLNFSGFPLNRARKIACSVRKSLAECAHEEIFVDTVWIACNGQDRQNTQFLAIEHDDESCSMRIVTKSGPYVNRDDFPSICHLTSSLCSTSTLCEFELKASGLYHVLSNDDVDGSSVHLNCEWKRPLATFAKPSLDAKTQAIIHLDAGDPRSVANCLYTELSVLMRFFGFIKSGEIVWCVDEYETPVRENLPEYFDTLADKEGTSEKLEQDFESYFSKIIEEKFIQVRSKMDFTDKLWDILIKSQSYSELKSGLLQVFESISGGYLRPQNLVGNKTRVGNICRDLMMRGGGSEPDLSGIVAMEMLIEMGLEKIKKDYINVFQVGELATGEQLMPFIDWDASKDSSSDCLHQLNKLHAALQIITLIRQHLVLPQSSLILCMDKVLSELLESETIVEDFVFTLQTSLIQDIFESFSPMVWKLYIDSNESYENSLEFIITKDNFNSQDKEKDELPSEALEMSLKEDEIASVTSHYCTAIRKIPDVFSPSLQGV